MNHLRYPCSSRNTITASACSRDSVVVWIIFLRLAGPFPIHATTSFRGVSFSSMDAASSTISTTCLACWVMSTVVKSGVVEIKWSLTEIYLYFIYFHIHMLYVHATCFNKKNDCMCDPSKTPFALRQVSHIWLHPSSSHTSSKWTAIRERRHLHRANMKLKRHSSHGV